MLAKVLFGYAFHAVDFNLDVVSAFDGIGHLVDVLFVNLDERVGIRIASNSDRIAHLYRMNLQSGTRVEFLVTQMAFEVLGFLML